MPNTSVKAIDWLFVMDHCSGIDIALQRGTIGEIYNVGGENEQHNIDVIRMMLSMLNKPESLLRRVADRPGHDRARRNLADRGAVAAGPTGGEPERGCCSQRRHAVNRRAGRAPDVGFSQRLGCER